MQTATIFNMQKFSLNDGPGIRTVIFFKGCPLRCRWCANPESQAVAPQMEWRDSACMECGACLALLPSAGARTIGGKSHVDVRKVDAATREARMAVDRCPGGALSITGRSRTVDEVLEYCLQDKPFYEDSGGGVTLSGGEAMMWPEFDLELLDRLRQNGIDTCIETEAYVRPEVFDAVAARLDHLLIDMKHWDPKRHRAGTGVTTDLILRNTRHAIEMGKDVLVRTPVIPGFNDSVEDAREMARTLREAGSTRVQLLPFHNYGENKYALLDMTYVLHGADGLKPADLEGFRQAYVGEGVDAFF